MSFATAAELPQQALLTRSPQSDRFVFSLPGIHCAGCIAKIEQGLSRRSNIHSVRVNLSRKRVTVQSRGLTASDIADYLTDLGFDAHRLDSGKLALDQDDEGRALLIRLAVAGFALMNVMLLSVSVWAGADGETRNLLYWISAAISLPILAFAATPFFRSAFSALRVGRLNMDVPISLAILLASLLSLYETSAGGAHAYFDAALSLTFFLLLGRYLNFRTRAAARSAATELAALEVSTAVLSDGSTVDVTSLQLGDIILVRPGMKFPVDGHIVKGHSAVNMALLTGESLPREVGLGDMVYSGTLNQGGVLEVEVSNLAPDSQLNKISELMQIAETAKSRFTGLAEQAAIIYAPLVHLLALAAFCGWFFTSGDLRFSLNIATSVLIITCPCALGLAVPAVMSAAISRLFSAGVLVKNGLAIERLALVRHVVFDKTGTLTFGQAELLEAPDDESLAIGAALARSSAHPLSQALYRAAKGKGLSEPEVSEVVEDPGFGVSGLYDGTVVKLGSAIWLGIKAETDLTNIWLGIGDQPPVGFSFFDALCDDAKSAVAELQTQGLELSLISGDNKTVTKGIADELGISRAFGAMVPQQKLSFINQQDKQCLMIGDGLNDAAAMSAAAVSMAPAKAMDVTRTSADMILLKPDLGLIDTARRLSVSARSRILENFAIAVIYNAVAIPLAVSGHATPLLAAIAMSSSSLLVSLNALRILGQKL